MIHSWRMREPLQCFLDGELSEAKRTALAGHLDQCARCASALRRLAESDQLLLSIRPVPESLSPAASRAVLDRALAEAGMSRSGPWRGLTLLAWGFSVFLVVVASGAAAWWCRPTQLARRHQALGATVATRGANEERRAAAPRGEDPSLSIEAAPSSRPEPPKNPARPGGARHAVKKSGPIPRPPAASVPRSEPYPPRHRPSRRRYVAFAIPRGGLPAIQPGEGGAAADQNTGEWLTSERESDLSTADAPGGSRQREAEDRECGILAERVLAAALDGDEAALQRVTQALLSDEPAAVASNAPAVGTPNMQVADWPLPWEGEDLKTRERLAAVPEPQLLVMVSSAPAPSAVTVTEAPSEAPGYARAIAFRPDTCGGSTWMQATASSEGAGTQLALVLLGDNAWQW